MSESTWDLSFVHPKCPLAGHRWQKQLPSSGDQFLYTLSLKEKKKTKTKLFTKVIVYLHMQACSFTKKIKSSHQVCLVLFIYIAENQVTAAIRYTLAQKISFLCTQYAYMQFLLI